MVSVTSLLALAYLACGLVPFALVSSVRRHSKKPGSTGLLVALIGLSIWSVAYGLAITSSAYSTVLALGSLVLFGGQLAAIGYLFLAIEYTETARLSTRLVNAAAVSVLAVQLLSLTDPIHGRLWGPTARPILDIGSAEPLATVLVVSTLAVAAVAALLLLADVITGPRARRNQSLALVAAGVPTLVITVIDVYVIDATVFSLLPFGVGISVFAIAWALFRANLLKTVPVGHRRIVEEMDDAAVVLDAQDRVVDCNPAARHLIGVDGDYAGTPVDEFFDTVPDAIERFRDTRGVDTEVTIPTDGERRDFHLTISPLEDGRPADATGRLIVLRDITPLKERERALEQRESELEFVSQLLTRVLRHNLRNDLSLVRGYAAMIANEGNPTVAPMAAEIVETSDELLATSRNARTIQRIIDREGCAEQLDLADHLEELVGLYRTDEIPATISLSIPDQCAIETDPELEYAFDILLETTLEHADPQATIEVALERTDEHATVTVIDEGACLPQTELAVVAQSDQQLFEQTNEIGLWIVHWIVERSTASMAIETGRNRNLVSIHVPRS
ncbi:PAS domain S-box protein [Salinadaptatus halalkaliphilus]|uniref:histidine kinase n=1 Tax=Salinadaptatus halalkaliphilus TaxID=2419781 RepID=A0A4S3TLB9_9EURY|nr:histidine kinase N-terminal 7TM domain-containing protein [Salinadaptatus halalkaliphilus]THE64949.1 PAS domain S-box protein [Salinadaptatus halalkaliphilus]